MITLSKHSLKENAPRIGPKNSDKKVTVSCQEGWIAVSENGETSIFTGGFAECLGVIIAPTERRGGLVGHVKQMGAKQKGNQETYMTQWVRELLKFALTRWNCAQADVALFRGEVAGMAWDLGLRGNQSVSHVLDLRQGSHGVSGCADFRFDPAKKKIYAPSGRIDTDRNMDATDRGARGTSLMIEEAQKAMPVLIYP